MDPPRLLALRARTDGLTRAGRARLSIERSVLKAEMAVMMVFSRALPRHEP
jgi:hypothetical protein